jgi:hypothetical protein
MSQLLLQYVSLDEAQTSGRAFIRVTGVQAPDGTARWVTDIKLHETTGVVRDLVLHIKMTDDEITKRAEALSQKKGVTLIVRDLQPLILGSFSGPAP